MMNLRSIRKPITTILGIVIICDLILAYKLWIYKPWTSIVDQDDGMVGNFRVVSVWTWGDLIWIFPVIIFQVGLAFLAYKSWVSKSKEDAVANNP
jgi:hypothetical protein